jgi:chromosome partitioning protein
VAADAMLVPLQCEYYALEGLSLLTQSQSLVRQSLNPGLSLAGIVLTLFDPRTVLSSQVVSEVRRQFGNQAFNTVIPRSVRLSEAPSHGLPITLYDPTGRGAAAYRALAEELLLRTAAVAA